MLTQCVSSFLLTRSSTFVARANLTLMLLSQKEYCLHFTRQWVGSFVTAHQACIRLFSALQRCGRCDKRKPIRDKRNTVISADADRSKMAQNQHIVEKYNGVSFLQTPLAIFYSSFCWWMSTAKSIKPKSATVLKTVTVCLCTRRRVHRTKKIYVHGSQ